MPEACMTACEARDPALSSESQSTTKPFRLCGVVLHDAPGPTWTARGAKRRSADRALVASGLWGASGETDARRVHAIPLPTGDTFMHFSRKKLTAFAAGAMTLGLTAGAYAYWTTSGSGDASAIAASS